MSNKKRVFSGIQPTGLIHIGNYIGALQNWVRLQDSYKCIYCVVDLHAITIPQHPEDLRHQILKTTAVLLAVGIDPKKSIVFVQSDVAAHSELEWILNCFVYFGELSRMTQFKEKATRRGVGASCGLFTYPVLMAADILLYQTHAVPVGEDQKQHLELTREIARRMNELHSGLFVVPEPIINKRGSRIMGLDNPLAKMSKTAASDLNYISLTDSPEAIRKKCQKAVTDSETVIRYDEEKKPAISNLLNIMSAVTGESIESLENSYSTHSGYAAFKKDLAEAVIAHLTPIRERILHFEKDPGAILRILKEGSDQANALASLTLSQVKKRLGLGGGNHAMP